ncbi:hypothetical protein CU098_011419 [Rhizopus stolonifer]|uniref:Uncharacterized protein n=1 Tax=Rhizopus stolonifer TaxID=4846 RepID=A0A367KUN7_RHIST|nr:hypothetical protein CU098_011419 [Rhizopus stolonifer]
MEKAKKEIFMEKQEKTFSRSRVRYLVLAEYNKHIKYQLKLDERKINASLERITFFQVQHSSNISNVQEMVEGLDQDKMDDNARKCNDSDVSRKRLFSLKAIIKDILLSKEGGYTTELMKDHYSDISKEELKIALLIVNNLTPYIPSKDVSCTIIHQFPFVMLANGLLEVTGYQRFTRKICPMPSVCLNALRVDGPALYHMLTSKVKDTLHIFDYDGYIIDSEEPARRHQDEVFGSVFDMKAIHKVCKSYKLDFSQSITIMHVLMTAQQIRRKT